jgi:tRNA(fMet)-specific endonuclease VapC
MLILDSNIISYYFRGHASIAQRLQAQSPAEIGVPAIVEYELRYGLMRLPQEAAQARIEALNKLLFPMQSLPFDAACAQEAALLRADLEKKGASIGPHDILIAATALRYQAPLVTHNVREFARVPGLQVIDWHEK